MPHDPIVLAIDIGTSSARVIAFNSKAEAIPGARAQISYELKTDPPGAAELDADVLVDTAARCIDSVLSSLGERIHGLRAVGCCTFWHSMVGVNLAGLAVTPLYTWADSRSGPVARHMVEEMDESAVHSRTGCAIHPSYFPARLRWLRETDSARFATVDRWVSPGEYLYLRFFGTASCSVSMASATGLFDQNRCAWDAQMISSAGITEANLLPVNDSDASPSGLQSPWVERWPALARIPWVPAIGDGAAGNLGSGCITDESAAINLGTSGAIRVLWEGDSVDIPPELWCYRLDRRHFVMGAAFSDGGEVYSWARRTLDLNGTDSEVDSALLRREPDSHGLTFLPFLAGERSIGWRPNARATLYGLTVGTEPMDILHAAMESVCLRFLLVWRGLRGYFPSAKRIIASGGALAESVSWRRILANSLGHELIVTTESEASSRGAAILALKAASLIKGLDELPQLSGGIVEPNSSAHDVYSAALERQQALYHMTQ